MRSSDQHMQIPFATAVPWKSVLLKWTAGIVIVSASCGAEAQSNEVAVPGGGLARQAAVVFGSRGVRAHDPSTIIRSGDEYWTFHTGRGVSSYHSKDLLEWKSGPRVFPEVPGWVTAEIPENRGAHFWAPDVIRVNGRYLLYYSVSSFGKNHSAIALATSPTLDPEDPGFRWTDHGIVVRSYSTNNFNAIDPALFRDRDGKLWMSFGSFWGGIQLIELDPATGLRISPGSPMHVLARNAQIEAPFIWREGDFYYLFVNWGFCCRGVNSTYEIRVGRSDRVTGPYRDREGVAMAEGGGTLLLAGDPPFIGPGHAGIFAENGTNWFSCHFYDGDRRGAPTLALRTLRWVEGWPVIDSLVSNGDNGAAAKKD